MSLFVEYWQEYGLGLDGIVLNVVAVEGLDGRIVDEEILVQLLSRP